MQGWECTPRFGWRGVRGRVGRGLPGHPAPGKPWLRLGKTTVRPSAWRRGNRLPGCSSRLCRQLLEASPQPGLMKLRLGLLICQNLENGRVELVSAVSICSSRQLSRRLAPKSPLGPSAHGGEDRDFPRPQDVRVAGPRVSCALRTCGQQAPVSHPASPGLRSAGAGLPCVSTWLQWNWLRPVSFHNGH